MAIKSTDVAKAAGVSRSTVSYILNGSTDRFSEETVKLVKETAHKLGYHPQGAARALVTGKSDVVVLVPPQAPNVLFFRQIRNLSAALAQHKFSLMLVPPLPDYPSFERALITTQPRMILAYAALPIEHEKLVQRLSIPEFDFASLSSHLAGTQFEVGRLQAEHFIKRGYNHFVYARLSEAQGDVIMKGREHGFTQTCSQHGLNVTAIDISPNPVMDLEKLFKNSTFSQTMRHKEKIAIACYNDDTALLLMPALKNFNLTIPTHVGLFGVDNTPAAQAATPGLTTIAVHIDPNAIAEYLVDDDANPQDFGPFLESNTSLKLIERETV